MGIFSGLVMSAIGSALDTTPKYKTVTEQIIENRKRHGLPSLTREELEKWINLECIDKERERLRRTYL